jgi:hypothetical protein
MRFKAALREEIILKAAGCGNSLIIEFAVKIDPVA